MCTYLNWPKAIKCTQCQRKRSPSPSDGTNSVVNNTVGSGISSMVNENTTFPLTIAPWTNSPSNNHHLTNDSATNTSAIVHHRSMSNSPSHGGNNANHCSMSESTGRNVANVTDNNKNLNYKNSITGGTRCKLSNSSSNYSSKHDAARNTTKSPPAMAIANPVRANSADDRSFSSAGAYINQNHNSFTIKWTCAACTYDNWPQSTKCVMCYTPRVAASAIIVDDEVAYDTKSINSHTYDQQLINCETNYGTGQVLADDGEYVDDTGIDDDIEDDFAIGTSKSTGNFSHPKVSPSNFNLNSTIKSSTLQQVPLVKNPAEGKLNLTTRSGFASNAAKAMSSNPSSISSDSRKTKSATMAKTAASNSNSNALLTAVDIVSSRIGQLNLLESPNTVDDAPLNHNNCTTATSSLDVTVDTSSSSQESNLSELPAPATASAATASINASSTSKHM